MTEPEHVNQPIDDVIDLLTQGRKREPVRNNVPRPPSEENRMLWHALMLRDGGRCWICGFGDRFMVMDHLQPRSSFSADEMAEADRSDNLRIACWSCNEDKSNRLIPFSKPLPIVGMCAVHHNGEYEDEGLQVVWCHTCQMTQRVPDWWPVWGMTGGDGSDGEG